MCSQNIQPTPTHGKSRAPRIPLACLLACLLLTRNQLKQTSTLFHSKTVPLGNNLIEGFGSSLEITMKISWNGCGEFLTAGCVVFWKLCP